MSDTATPHRALERALTSERDAIAAFQMLLQREHAALQTLEAIDSLEQTTLDKHEHATHMQTLSDARDALLRDAGHPLGAEGIERAAAEDASLAAAWASLRAAVTEAARQNQANGALIQAGLQDTQLRLDTLRRLQSPSASVYDARGRTLASPARRPLGVG